MSNQPDQFWEEVSKKLTEKHPNHKDPSRWSKKKDFEPIFEKHIKQFGSISYSTFRRIFQEKGYESASIAIKDVFAEFIGYSSFEVYKPKSRDKKLKTNRNPIFIALSLFLLLGLMICSRLEVKSNTNLKEQQRIQDSINVVEIVKQAVDLELNSYKSIPTYKPYLDSLEHIFWKGESAYNNILEVLTAQSELNWTLMNTGNPSNNELLNISLYSLQDNRAVVSTEEFWQLEWYGRETHEYEYLYNHKNTQKYTLTKEDSIVWKILINDYEFDFYRKPPMIPDCIYILDEGDDVKQKIYQAAKVGNAELATRILDCHYSRNISNIPNEVLEFISRNSLLFRHLNTDIITEDEFNEERQKLIHDITTFVNKN